MLSEYIVRVTAKHSDTAVAEVEKELSKVSLTYSIDEVDEDTVYLIITMEGDEEDAMTEYVQQELSRTKLDWNLEDICDDILLLDDDFWGTPTEFTSEDGGL